MKLTKLLMVMFVALGMVIYAGCEREEPGEAGAETRQEEGLEYQQEEEMDFGQEQQGAEQQQQDQQQMQRDQQQMQRDQQQMQREQQPMQRDQQRQQQQGQISGSELSDAAKQYIERQSQQQNGYFVITDEVTGDQVRLQLQSVEEEAMQLGPNTYFTSATFETEQGQEYVLDLFMTGETADDLTFSTATIKEAAGQKRYEWKEQQGMQQIQPVEGQSVPQETQQKIQRLQQDQGQQMMDQQQMDQQQY